MSKAGIFGSECEENPKAAMDKLKKERNAARNIELRKKIQARSSADSNATWHPIHCGHHDSRFRMPAFKHAACSGPH